MRLLMLAAMTSLAVCRLGSSLPMGVGLVVVYFMISAPCTLAFALHAVAACSYMPNASWRRRGWGGGSPTIGAEAKAGAKRGKRSGGLHKRSAEDWGYPLRRAGGSAH